MPFTFGLPNHPDKAESAEVYKGFPVKLTGKSNHEQHEQTSINCHSLVSYFFNFIKVEKLTSIKFYIHFYVNNS